MRRWKQLQCLFQLWYVFPFGHAFYAAGIDFMGDNWMWKFSQKSTIVKGKADKSFTKITKNVMGDGNKN